MLFYGISFHKKLLGSDAIDGSDNVDVSSEKRVSNIQEEVKQLSDNLGKNNDEIEDVDKLCTLELANELFVKQEEVNSMLKAIGEWLNKKENENRGNVTGSVIKLQKFLQSIVAQTQFKLDNRGEVVQSTDVAESVEETIDVDGINNTIGGYRNRIDMLIGNVNISSVDVKPTLDNIKKVLNNPSNKSYVKQLQEYLYNSVYKNLSDKLIFVQKNGEEKGDNFQWNWDISRLLESKALDVILGRIENSQNSLNVGGVVYQREQSSSIKVTGESALTDVNLYDVSPHPNHDDQAPGEALTGNLSADVTLLNDKLNLEPDEKMYFMKVGKNTYAVKLDRENYLSPIALDVSDGNLNNPKTVYLKNNSSCIWYLENRIPSEVRNYLPDVKITWDGSDYAIWVPGKKMLTIEPMTLNGTWISDNLWECLSMLCFVNYLRNEKWIDGYEFDNDNPDLSWKDGEDPDAGKLLVAIKKSDDKEKRKMAKEQSGSKHKAVVDLQRFWLNFLRDKPEVRKRFLKYNNGEDWEDNWDKKKENKSITNRVDLSEELAKNEYKAPAAPAQAPWGWNGWSRVSWGSGVEAPSYPFVYSLNSSWLWSNAVKYWIKSENSNYPQVYQYWWDWTNLDLCYQENNTIVRISNESYWMRQIWTWTISTSGLQSFNLTKEELNVCEKWAEQLNDKLLSVYNEITEKNDESLPSSLSIDITNDKYSLKFDNNKSIPLDDLIFSQKGEKFCGFENNQLNERLKIALLAYAHYDQIESSDRDIVITNTEKDKYGIDDKNKIFVQQWFNDLNWSNSNKKLVILPWKNEILRNIWSFDNNNKFKLNQDVGDNDVINFWGIDYKLNDNGLCYQKYDDGIYIWEYLYGTVTTWRWIALYADDGDWGEWKWKKVKDGKGKDVFHCDNYGFSV